MATNIICRCDECGSEKGETNHWFEVRATERGFAVFPLGAPEDGEHICGQECLHKRLSQWLEAKQIKEES